MVAERATHEGDAADGGSPELSLRPILGIALPFARSRC